MTSATLSIRSFDASDTEAVVALWQDVFPEYRNPDQPQRDPHLSIANKLATQPELFFVTLHGERLVGTVMAGYDGHRGWLYSLAVDPRAAQARHRHAARRACGSGLGGTRLPEGESAGIDYECRRARVLRSARLSGR